MGVHKHFLLSYSMLTFLSLICCCSFCEYSWTLWAYTSIWLCSSSWNWQGFLTAQWLSEVIEPAICDMKTESGEANDLEVNTPARDAKISFFHLEICVDRKLEKCSQKKKILKPNLHHKGLCTMIENNICSFLLWSGSSASLFCIGDWKAYPLKKNNNRADTEEAHLPF